MSEETHRDSVVDEVTDKVVQRGGTSAPEAEVRPMAEKAVDELVDQPVQTFTPLLAENSVLTELHAEADAETADADADADGAAADRGDRGDGGDGGDR